MAIVPFNAEILVPSDFSAYTPTSFATGVQLLIDGATEKLAHYVRAPRAGTIDGVEFLFNTVGQAPVNGLKVSFQGKNLASGSIPCDPDGVAAQYRVIPQGSCVADTWTFSGIMSDNGLDGGAKRVVTAGEWFWIVFEFENWQAGDTVGIDTWYAQIIPEMGGTLRDIGAGWVYGPQARYKPNVLIKYDDGTYGRVSLQGSPTALDSNQDQHSIGTGTDPDEIALRFKLPVPMTIKGAWSKLLYSGATEDFTIRLLGADDSVLASVQVKPDEHCFQVHTHLMSYFDEEVELAANTVYRLSFRPDTADLSMWQSFILPTIAHMAATEWGAEFFWSQRVNDGAWVDTTTRRMFAGLVVSGMGEYPTRNILTETEVLWPWNTTAMDRAPPFYRMDDSPDMHGFVIQAPADGTLEGIVFACTNVNVATGVKFSLHGITEGATVPEPDGVITHYRTVIPGAHRENYTGIMSDDGTDNGAKKTLSKGDLFFLQIEIDNWQAGEYIDLGYNKGSQVWQVGNVACKKIAGTWSKIGSEYVPGVCLRYDDGTYHRLHHYAQCGVFHGGFANTHFSPTASSFTKGGMAFIAPETCDLLGINIFVGSGANDRDVNFYLVLWDFDTKEELAKTDIDYGKIYSDTTTAPIRLLFDEAVTLTRGRKYMVGIEGIYDVGQRPQIYSFMMDAERTHFNSIYGLESWKVPTVSGVWTQDTANYMLMFPLVLTNFQLEEGGAAVELDTFLSWPAFLAGTLPTNDFDRVIDADGEKLGYTIRAPKAGTIEAFVFSTGTVTQDPANGVKVSFQGVDADGFPDGVVSHYRVYTTIASADNHETGLITDDGTDNGNKKTVTKGEIFSVVIEFESFLAGDNLEIRDGYYAGALSIGYLSTANWYHTAAWQNTLGSSVRGILKYDDGSYETLAKHMGDGARSTSSEIALFDVNSTPDEVGVKFSAPYDCRLYGFVWFGGIRNETFNVILYDENDSVIATLVYGTDFFEMYPRTVSAVRTFWFADRPELSEASVYRLTFLPSTDSGAGVLIGVFDFKTAAYASALVANYIKTERTGGGAWTDTNTKRPAMALLFDRVGGGSEGGGAGVPQSLHTIEAGITA